ncbi:c158fba1-4f20-4c81-b119-e22c77bf3318 [Sclerotinia trifoliorum]|uniref:C158fba1-4f20-4c81-b119-e22c77bf3318 n=1 Tax=Sclerotinia trifoliorum TaxID=28548 RepID=A0A8H2VR90_9HELO|nr:c158fba1-4f20-4c81-b119-e22c77bf3318 [Sclerotinia trifoliorum]
MDRPSSEKEEPPTASQSDEPQTHEVEVKSSNGDNKDHERSEGLISRYHKQILKGQIPTETRRDLEKLPDVKGESSADGMEGYGSAENQKTPNRANINHRQTHSDLESMTARVARARRNAILEGSVSEPESHEATQKHQSWSEEVDGSKTVRVTTELSEHGLVSTDSRKSLEPLSSSASSPIPIPPSGVLPPHHVGSEGVYRNVAGLPSEMLTPEESESRTTAAESPEYKLQVDASSFGHTVEKRRTPRSMSDGFGATVAMYNKLKDLSVKLEQNKSEELVDRMKKKTKNAGMKDDAEKN